MADTYLNYSLNSISSFYISNYLEENIFNTIIFTDYGIISNESYSLETICNPYKIIWDILVLFLVLR